MRLHIKLAMIAFLSLLLTIPLYFVVSKIYERDSYHVQAQSDISQVWTGDQQVLGPILVVPYTRVVEVQEFNKELEKYFTVRRERTERIFILPDTLNGKIELRTEILYRGIYEVPVYSSAMTLDGEISNARVRELADRGDVVAVGQPYLSIAVDDMRGIAESPALVWDAQRTALLPGSNVAFQTNGIHAPIDDLDHDSLATYRFSIALSLRGMSSFRFAPVGDTSSINVSSTWPHPRFEGFYSPVRREVSDAGFNADWKVSGFATNMSRKADACASSRCDELLNSYFGVMLIDPVDVYLQAQRASKYGILFIGLTFAAFFLFEVLKHLAIHPVQYTLVGLALTVFYLLLISLAEHIAFIKAYWIAAGACCALLGFYITFVLKSFRRGGSFASGIAILYGILYVTIQAEDYAFLMGATLIFVALSGVMYITRSTDWFRLSQEAIGRPEPANTPATGQR